MTSIAEAADSYSCRRTLVIDGRSYVYFSLAAAEANGLVGISSLPIALKILLENLLRHEDGRTVTADDIRAVQRWLVRRRSDREITFRPTRVLMQDFTGVPALVDLAAMRDAAVAGGADAVRVNPAIPVDLVIDHSVTVDRSGSPEALDFNMAREFQRNEERYRFLRWSQAAFANLRVVPPGMGICHQINLEYLAQVIQIGAADEPPILYPDTLVGTDSHTTMVNGIAVLGWGVGGIEAEAAMLGQPLSMALPEVIGVKLSGCLAAGVTATDLVLTLTQWLRRKGVVNRFIEFFGSQLSGIRVEDRATVANMAPEYGATCSFFPADAATLEFLRATGREDHRLRVVDAYCRAQGMLRSSSDDHPCFTEVVEFDLGSVEPSLSGPTRPQDRVPLPAVPGNFADTFDREDREAADARQRPAAGAAGLRHGDIVIAAITSCTNTSNPTLMVGAGLLARKALARGLRVKPWVKTSLAPGSRVVMDYLAKARLDRDLALLGFDVVGYGCTTCVGNSGPLSEPISAMIRAHDLVVAAVLSGNRNFESRISLEVKANYLASPPLVVAYALAGTVTIDLVREPIGIGSDGGPVYLHDLWPTLTEIDDVLHATLSAELFRKRYRDIFAGDRNWQALEASRAPIYSWEPSSSYICRPPYFDDVVQTLGLPPKPVEDVVDARILALLLDSITTDHISPVGPIEKASPAGSYLSERGIAPQDYNTYGTRRGNHEVMVRGTFANTRLKNQMLPGVEGGMTVHQPSGQPMPIYDAALRYRAEAAPLVIFAGKEYGTGSARDWAAKGTKLLGVRAIVAESFERIHRANLVGMGVLPIMFEPGTSWQGLGLSGREKVSIKALDETLKTRARLFLEIVSGDARTRRIPAICAIDTLHELECFRSGGILSYTLRRILAEPVA